MARSTRKIGTLESLELRKMLTADMGLDLVDANEASPKTAEIDFVEVGEDTPSTAHTREQLRANNIGDHESVAR